MDARHPLDLLLPYLGSEPVEAVLDLGSGTGSTATHLRRTFPTARVFAFECDPSALIASGESLGEAGVELIPIAAARHGGQMRLYAPSTNSTSASSLAPMARGSGCIELQVKCTRLDEWCDSRGLTPDIVWCDIEGDTLGALQGLGRYLRTARVVYVAVSYRALYLGQPTFRDVDSHLKGTGHRLVEHVQCNPGHWGYALYSSRQPVIPVKKVPCHAEGDELPYARGGIGDLLQYLPAAVRAHRIRVLSHYAGAASFLRRVGVDAFYTPFDANSCSLAWAEAGVELEREYFPMLPIPRGSITLRPAGGKIIGLHPYGSAYSNTFADRSGGPSKWMPPAFTRALLKRCLGPSDRVLLFCSPADRHRAAETLNDYAEQAVVVANSDPWDSFSMIPLCDAIVAVDSSVKTVSAMLRKPTVTMIGDFCDPFRDRHFVDPYVTAGIMQTVRYKTMGQREADLASCALATLLQRD